MANILYKRPTFWDESPDYPLFKLKRGKKRSRELKAILIAVLRALGSERPTANQLRQFSGIRRTVFLKLLRSLVENRIVHKEGRGAKKDPYLYRLDLKYFDEE